MPRLRSGALHRAALLLALVAAIPMQASGQTYWPGRNLDWERRRPEELGLDPAKIQQAVDLALANEVDSPRELALNHQRTFGREPHGEPIGPFTVRGSQTGLIVHRGYIVAEWGDPYKVDNTFSVAKSFLSTTVGLAYDRGLINDVNDLVRPYVAPIILADGDGEPGDEGGQRPKLLFESEHNRGITWDHLLRQTSDWEGTLWGKPEWADRPDRDPSRWGTRARVGPGTVFEYNDVRVNLLALAATNVWRRPLPEVLRDYVMDPIGASPTWRWVGYDNSWITLDGRPVQSVSGGSHWGGGMLIHAFDMARFGLLTLRKGEWDGERDRLRGMARDGDHAHGRADWLWLHELLPEHRQALAAERARGGVDPYGCGTQHDLRGSGQRPGDREPVGQRRYGSRAPGVGRHGGRRGERALRPEWIDEVIGRGRGRAVTDGPYRGRPATSVWTRYRVFPAVT